MRGQRIGQLHTPLDKGYYPQVSKIQYLPEAIRPFFSNYFSRSSTPAPAASPGQSPPSARIPHENMEKNCATPTSAARAARAAERPRPRYFFSMRVCDL